MSTRSPRAAYASKPCCRNLWPEMTGVAVASASTVTTLVRTAILVSERDSEHDVPTGVERELLVAAQETAVAHIRRIADREIDVADPAEQRPHDARREVEQRVPRRRDVERSETGAPRGDPPLDARVGAGGPGGSAT